MRVFDRGLFRLRQLYQTMPNGGASLTEWQGMIGDGHVIQARYDTTAEANAALRDARFIRIDNSRWRAAR